MSRLYFIIYHLLKPSSSYGADGHPEDFNNFFVNKRITLVDNLPTYNLKKKLTHCKWSNFFHLSLHLRIRLSHCYKNKPIAFKSHIIFTIYFLPQANIPASDCVASTPSISTSEWAESRCYSSAISRATSSSRLVTAVSARYHGVAKFISGKTLSIVASKRSFGTFCIV